MADLNIENFLNNITNKNFFNDMLSNYQNSSINHPVEQINKNLLEEINDRQEKVVKLKDQLRGNAFYLENKDNKNKNRENETSRTISKEFLNSKKHPKYSKHIYSNNFFSSN